MAPQVPITGGVSMIKVGDYIRHSRLGIVRVTAVYSAGTIDVINRDGNEFRVTGLSLATQEVSA